MLQILDPQPPDQQDIEEERCQLRQKPRHAL
jgi:hypothetical protein